MYSEPAAVVRAQRALQLFRQAYRKTLRYLHGSPKVWQSALRPFIRTLALRGISGYILGKPL